MQRSTVPFMYYFHLRVYTYREIELYLDIDTDFKYLERVLRSSSLLRAVSA